MLGLFGFTISLFKKYLAYLITPKIVPHHLFCFITDSCVANKKIQKVFDVQLPTKLVQKRTK